jgi:hypothetical protein
VRNPLLIKTPLKGDVDLQGRMNLAYLAIIFRSGPFLAMIFLRSRGHFHLLGEQARYVSIMYVEVLLPTLLQGFLPDPELAVCNNTQTPTGLMASRAPCLVWAYQAEFSY